jgi:hypothetical protein
MRPWVQSPVPRKEGRKEGSEGGREVVREGGKGEKHTVYHKMVLVAKKYLLTTLINKRKNILK